MTKQLWIFFLAAAMCTVPLPAQDYGSTLIVSVEKSERNLKILSQRPLDILMEKNGRIFIVAGRQDLDYFRTEFLQFTDETLNFYPFVLENTSFEGGINGDFHSYPELERDLFSLESAYPALAQVSAVGTSLENRNIYALKISDNVTVDEQEAEVLFVGCHHAREWISVEVPYLLGKHLLENYDSDATVRNLVDQSEIWIVPLLNPDGLEYSIYFYRYWRKNRRDNGNGTFGVDLNRNYDYKWGYDDEGSSSDTDWEDYRGTHPFSEPETQAVRDLFARRQFQFIVSYHSHSQVILYPWGYIYEQPPQIVLLDELAGNMSHRMEAVNGRVYDYGQAAGSLYTTNGDTIDWAFGIYGIPSYTIELPPMYSGEGQFFNSEEDILPIFYENLEACLYMIGWAVQNAPQFRDRPSLQERRPAFFHSRIKK